MKQGVEVLATTPTIPPPELPAVTVASEASKSDPNEQDRLEKECRAMVKLVKRLRTEEEDLREKNEMLAREALSCGFQLASLEAPPPKRRPKISPVKK
jgi:hypothetical protein